MPGSVVVVLLVLLVETEVKRRLPLTLLFPTARKTQTTVSSEDSVYIYQTKRLIMNKFDFPEKRNKNEKKKEKKCRQCQSYIHDGLG